jgi:hypothetical protein
MDTEMVEAAIKMRTLFFSVHDPDEMTRRAIRQPNL